MLGIEPGPQLLDQELPTAMIAAWAVALGNLLTIPLFLLTVPFIVGMTALRPAAVVPFALVAAVTATYVTNPTAFGLAQFVVGGLLGLLLKLSGLPRAPFLLGFVMGPIAETSLAKTIAIFGWDALLRPGVIALGAIMLFVLFRLRAPAETRGLDDPYSRPVAYGTLAGMMALAAAAAVVALGYSYGGGVAPIGAAAITAGAALVAIIRLRSKPDTPPPRLALGLGGVLALSVLAMPLCGLIPASLLFVGLTWRRVLGGRWRSLLLVLVATAALQYLMMRALIPGPLGFGLLGQVLADLLTST
jgi:putative tricarboxylic transport membrane protein